MLHTTPLDWYLLLRFSAVKAEMNAPGTDMACFAIRVNRYKLPIMHFLFVVFMISISLRLDVGLAKWAISKLSSAVSFIFFSFLFWNFIFPNLYLTGYASCSKEITTTSFMIFFHFWFFLLLRIKTPGRKAPFPNSQKVKIQTAHWIYI